MELKEHLQAMREARELISGIVRTTPVLHARTFSEMTQSQIHLKLENLQRTGSFKIRGAYTKIERTRRQNPQALANGVITASAGNHAQGVALAAAHAKVSATIVMSESSPLAKVEATRRYGASVILKGHSYDDAYEYAQKLGKENQQFFVHPFDDLDVIHGQGTSGLELIEQVPTPDVVIVPIGGGGFISGVALALKALSPKTRVIGVQAATMNPMELSFRQKKRVVLKSGYTMAEGIGVKQPGEKTWEIIRQYVDDVVSVPDEEIASAIALMLERAKVVAEGAGAASLAAALYGHVPGIEGKQVVCMVSGGNIDISLFRELTDPQRGRPGAPHSHINLILQVTSKSPLAPGTSQTS